MAGPTEGLSIFQHDPMGFYWIFSAKDQQCADLLSEKLSASGMSIDDRNNLLRVISSLPEGEKEQLCASVKSLFTPRTNNAQSRIEILLALSQIPVDHRDEAVRWARSGLTENDSAKRVIRLLRGEKGG